MRHRSSKRILNRPADQRKALMRSLLTSLFLEGGLTTTEAKAKALMSDAEKLMTLVTRRLNKNEEMNAIRELKKVLFTEASQKAALAFAKNLKKQSGFTRAVRVGFRPGDGAIQMKVDLISE